MKVRVRVRMTETSLSRRRNNHFLRNIPFFFFSRLVMLLESEETRSNLGRPCDDTVVAFSAFPNEEAPATFTRPLRKV